MIDETEPLDHPPAPEDEEAPDTTWADAMARRAQEISRTAADQARAITDTYARRDAAITALHDDVQQSRDLLDHVCEQAEKHAEAADKDSARRADAIAALHRDVSESRDFLGHAAEWAEKHAAAVDQESVRRAESLAVVHGDVQRSQKLLDQVREHAERRGETSDEQVADHTKTLTELREDIQIIGNMFADMSHRLETLERLMDTNRTSSGTRARDAWASRRDETPDEGEAAEAP